MMRNLLMVGLAAAMLPMTDVQAQTGVRQPTADEAKALEKMFLEIDRNGNGSVSKTEMSAYGHSKGYGVLVKAKGWKRMDDNGNSTISRDEFVKEMIRYRDSRKH